MLPPQRRYAAFLLLLSVMCSAAPVVKIMPLGDSITFGCGTTCGCPAGGAPYCKGGCGFPLSHFCASCAGGYRVFLERQLNASSYAFEFVGSQGSGPPEMKWPAHEGIPGISISSQTQRMGPLMQKFLPDIVLLHLVHNI